MILVTRFASMSPKSWIPLMYTLYSNSSAEPSKTPAYFYKLPYIGTFSNATQNKLRRLLKRYCKNLDIKLLVFSTFKLRDMFSVQDTVLPGLRSQVVYKFACASYIGETTMYSLPHFHVRPWAPGFGQKFTRLQTFRLQKLAVLHALQSVLLYRFYHHKFSN